MSLLYTFDAYERPNPRGQNLHVYEYKTANPKAAVMFHHGYSEYCGWYKRLFTIFCEAGFHVFAYDAHGHGHSEPRHKDLRVAIEDAEHLVEDAADFLEGVVLPGSEALPLFGVAHSMGATVLSLVEATRPGTFMGLALNAPALGKRFTVADNIALTVNRVLLQFCPTARIIPGKIWPAVTDETWVLDRLSKDPLCERGDVRICTAHSLGQAWSRLNGCADKITCPCYVQWACEEKYTCRLAARHFVTRSSSKDITWHEIKGGAMHAMIHGRRAAGLITAMRDWMLGVLSGEQLDDPDNVHEELLQTEGGGPAEAPERLESVDAPVPGPEIDGEPRQQQQKQQQHTEEDLEALEASGFASVESAELFVSAASHILESQTLADSQIVAGAPGLHEQGGVLAARERLRKMSLDLDGAAAAAAAGAGADAVRLADGRRRHEVQPGCA